MKNGADKKSVKTVTLESLCEGQMELWTEMFNRQNQLPIAALGVSLEPDNCEISVLYNEGMDLNQVVEILGVAITQIRERLKRGAN